MTVESVPPPPLAVPPPLLRQEDVVLGWIAGGMIALVFAHLIALAVYGISVAQVVILLICVTI